MKRLAKWAAIGTGALLLIAVGASLAQPDPVKVAGDIPRVTASLTPTPSPTATPSPTPTPTPEPTPTPDAGLAGFVVFGEHVVTYSASMLEDLDAVTAAADANDMLQLAEVSVTMWANLGDEVAWIAGHTPAPCYQAMYDSYAEAIGLYYEALDLISDGAIYNDFALLDQGIVKMGEATTATERTNVLIGEVAC